MTASQEVAQTILLQLGGRRFAVMTGANNFVATGSGLRFRIPRGLAKDGINCVQIDLTPMDDYTLTFSRIRGTNVTEVDKREGVYNDNLQEVFERVTGLATAL